MFGKFKLKLNERTSECQSDELIRKYNVYDFSHMLRHAYYVTFTRVAIVDTFEKSSMFPVHANKLMSVPVQRSHEDATILTLAEHLALYAEKRQAARQRILGADIEVTATRFVDTTHGAMLTTSATTPLDDKGASVRYGCVCNARERPAAHCTA